MIGSYLSIGLLLSTLLPLIQSESVVFQSSTPRVFKIAVIGSGPSGASAAYFLSKANDLLANSSSSDSIQVTVFEKEERIGGRTAIAYPYDDHRYDPVELGASIFADVNRNLKRAVKDFGLETGARIGEPESILGIWDGQQFLIEGIDEGWWNSARFLWRYGYSPLTARGLVKKLVSKFLKLYDTSFLHRPSSKSDFEASIYSNSSQTSESAISEGSYTRSGYPWHSIEDLAQALNFTEFAAQDAESMFYNQGVSKLFVEEMIEAATRVNYAQNVDRVHGIGGGVSLAASGATGVRSGNYRIFEEMIGRSGAKLRLGKSGEVTGLIKFSNLEEAFKAGKVTQKEFDSRTLISDQSGAGFENESEYMEGGNESLSSQKSSAKWWLGTESGFGELYDAVFVGTPWKNSGISLINTDKTIPTPDYVHLHVTLLVTNASHPAPAYFGRGKADDVPTTILTSASAVRRASQDKDTSKSNQVWDLNPFGRKKREEIRKREPKLEFNSLNYLAKLPPLSADFSSRSKDQSKSLSTEHLVKIFSLAHMSDEKLVEIMGDSIRWTYRKEWDAYPVLSPTREFPPVEPDENLFFINALESLVSTMETSTVASRNSVAIFLERNFGHQFVHGGSNCPDWDEEDSDEENDQSDWASWGCRSG